MELVVRTGTCGSRTRSSASTDGIPRLYQKYIGHDDNRDFYMSNQPETTNMNRVLYREWFPQIMYNHHQTGPAGTVMFAPPFRDPFNYNFDPLIPLGIDLVGAAMHTRFAAEDKPGATMRIGRDATRPGGTAACARPRTSTTMIGLLTETIGNPTPIDDSVRARACSCRAPTCRTRSRRRRWHFRQSIDYSVTANYAVLDFASRTRGRCCSTST